MLVDRVLVVEVAHDAAVDPLEFREDRVEQPAIVHLRQPGVETLVRLQQLPELMALCRRGDEVIRRKAVDVLLDAVSACSETAASRSMAMRKCLEPQRGLHTRRVRSTKRTPVGGDLEMPADSSRWRCDGAAGEWPRRAGANEREITRAPAEVFAHQHFDALMRLSAGAAHHSATFSCSS